MTRVKAGRNIADKGSKVDSRLANVEDATMADIPVRSSMAIDASGALWIGMRQLVLRLTPTRARFSETWLVREDCRRAEQIDLDCIYRGG